MGEQNSVKIDVQLVSRPLLSVATLVLCKDPRQNDVVQNLHPGGSDLEVRSLPSKGGATVELRDNRLATVVQDQLVKGRWRLGYGITAHTFGDDIPKIFPKSHLNFLSPAEKVYPLQQMLNI